MIEGISLDLQVVDVIVGLALIILSLAFGRVSERESHFVYPFDIWSMAVYVVVPTVYITSAILSSGLIPYWMPIIFVVFYLIGVVISGRKKHISLIYMDGGKFFRGPWVVLYRHNQRWAIAFQSPVDHLRRLVHKEHIYVNGYIDPEKCFTFALKDPYFPMPDVSVLLCNKVDLGKREIAKTARGKEYRKRAPIIETAFGSTLSTFEALFFSNSYGELVSQNTYLSQQLIKEQYESEVRQMDIIANTVIKGFSCISPIDEYEKHINEKKEGDVVPVKVERRRLFRRVKDADRQ